MFFHSLLQWTMFCQNFPPLRLGWPYTAWLIVSLCYTKLRKLEIQREHFMQRWAQLRTEMVWTRGRRYQEEVAGIHRRTVKKKDLNDLDNYIGVITHLEPDILECEVKWALGSTTMNKASGGDWIPAELFQILNYDAVKMLHSICQEIWKIQQWPQGWKRSVFIPITRKGNAKECSN